MRWGEKYIYNLSLPAHRAACGSFIPLKKKKNRTERDGWEEEVWKRPEKHPPFGAWGGQWSLPFFSYLLKLILQLFKVTALPGRGAPI